MDPLRHVKPVVRGLSAYTLKARPAAVKLDQNENPFDLPEDFKRAVVERALARDWARYPEFDPKELCEALARHWSWRADGVLAGNGSNELIEALLVVTVGEGTPVVIPEPTFTLYGLLTQMLGGSLVRVPLGPGLEYDAAAIARARREHAAPVTIVCSPNNPTGSAIALEDVSRLCDEADGLVVLDEAYHEFSDQDAVPLLARHPNLVVLRTFSKAGALAGLRLGALLASPELVREVNKARLPYNVNFFSQAAALHALERRELLAERVARLRALREALLARLRDVDGVRVYPTAANFVLVELLSAEPKAVQEALYARGVLVRDVSSYPRLARCLRFSVGSADENEALLRGLREVLAPVEASR